jgi:hypothetical protein
MIYVLSDDLMDSSKILTTLRAEGIEGKQLRSLTVCKTVTPQPGDSLVIDLHFPDLNLPEILDQFTGCSTIAYGSHVDAQRLRSARELGVQKVLPRSSFFGDVLAAVV